MGYVTNPPILMHSRILFDDSVCQRHGGSISANHNGITKVYVIAQRCMIIMKYTHRAWNPLLDQPNPLLPMLVSQHGPSLNDPSIDAAYDAFRRIEHHARRGGVTKQFRPETLPMPVRKNKINFVHSFTHFHIER